jgi:hypothetical protein
MFFLKVDIFRDPLDGITLYAEITFYKFLIRDEKLLLSISRDLKGRMS